MKKITNLIYYKSIALIFVASLFIKCFYFQFITHISERPIRSELNFKMLIGTLGILIVIAALITLTSIKTRRWLFLGIDILVSFLLIADILYYRYYTTVITIPVLFQMKLIGAVGQSITSLAAIRDLILFIDIPVILAICIWATFVDRKSQPRNITFRRRLAFCSVALLIGIIMQIYPVQANESFNINNNAAIRKWGILFFHFNDTKTFVLDSIGKSILSSNDRKKIIDFYAEKQKEKAALPKNLNGIAKGKNLLVVQVEAFQQFAIGRSINGKEITPNMNKLTKDWMYFDSIYQQVAGGNTSDAEFMTNTSMYPTQEGSVYFRYPTNTYDSLGNQLKSKGYNTYVSHAYIRSYWNRDTIYNFLGFDKYFSYYDYKIDEFVGWGGYALSDTTFFRQTLKKIDTKKPFYSFMITLSGHHPFTYFNDKKNYDAGEYQGTIFGSYLKSLNYSDQSLGFLIDQLKTSGLLDNTLVVIYGDHSGLPENQSTEFKKYLAMSGNSAEWLSYHKIPLFIHYPGMEKGSEFHVTGGQMDIYPTIANLMDLNPQYTMGKDLINSKTGYARLRSGNIATDDYIFVSDTGKCYTKDDFKPIVPSDLKQILDKLEKEQEINQLVLKKDALMKIGK